MRRLASLALAAALLVAVAATTAQADHQAFLGRWNLTGTGADSTAVYWLELKEEGGQLSGMFLNRGGSPVKLALGRGQGRRAGLHDRGARGPHRPDLPREAQGRQAGRLDDGRRADDRVHRRPSADVEGGERQRDAHLRQAGRAVRRQVARHLGRADAQPADRLDGRRRRDDQRGQGQQPRLEADLQGLQDPGGVQDRARQQQRHLPARPLRAAGARRLRQGARVARPHGDLRVGRAERQRQQAGGASGRRWRR